MQTYGIGELAEEFGVTLRAIRFYEDHGLLRPLREGQKRVYREGDRVRLKLILRGKRLGFSLAEVSEILALYERPKGEAGQLHFLLDKIAARRAELMAKRRDIDASLKDLEQVARNCRKTLKDMKSGGARTAADRRAVR